MAGCDCHSDFEREVDDSDTAWGGLAIRSAQLAGLPIGRSALTRAERFVDSCAVTPEEAKLSRYAYQPPTPDKPQPEELSLSDAGLLCPCTAR